MPVQFQRHSIHVVGCILCGSYIFWHPMRLFIFLGFMLVTWVYGEQLSDFGNNLTILPKENDRIRAKRTVTSPTAHPSPKLVAVLTKQTEFMSSVLRKILSLELKWFKVMASKSKSEVVAFLVVGITITFVIILIPLVLLAKILVPPLPILEGRKITNEYHQPDLDFPLPFWMDQMESWMDAYKSGKKLGSSVSGRLL